MSFTPLLATWAEIQVFMNDIKPADFGMDATTFITMREMVHETAEAQILRYLNRIDMDSTDLSGDSIMAAMLKHATCMLVAKYFDYYKSARTGRVIKLDELTVQVLNPEIFSPEIKKLIGSYKYYTVYSVDPDEDYS